jgi:hypothetical protein
MEFFKLALSVFLIVPIILFGVLTLSAMYGGNMAYILIFGAITASLGILAIKSNPFR